MFDMYCDMILNGLILTALFSTPLDIEEADFGTAWFLCIDWMGVGEVDVYLLLASENEDFVVEKLVVDCLEDMELLLLERASLSSSASL
mmetsp:Transcript_12213/g.18312  ORF Transcript_12213/g.18312 Transcript_12213/m.18312 type:complete len:89 (+) Transcript_12213:77-343(+)